MEAILTRASYLGQLEELYLSKLVRYVHRVPQQSNRIIYKRVENINCEEDGDGDFRVTLQLGTKRYEVSREQFEASITLV